MIDLEKLAVKSLVEHNGELVFSKEKFAELIVRECATVSENYAACRAYKMADAMLKERGK
jgi:hypothetical protein